MTLTENDIALALKEQFRDSVKLHAKRPNIYQVVAPVYHEDGDMLDIFATPTSDGIRFSDYGMTLMRLSYSFDLDTENKMRIFRDLLKQNSVEFDEATGSITLDSKPNLIVAHFFTLHK
jgi:hypothetical protein